MQKAQIVAKRMTGPGGVLSRMAGKILQTFDQPAQQGQAGGAHHQPETVLVARLVADPAILAGLEVEMPGIRKLFLGDLGANEPGQLAPVKKRQVGGLRERQGDFYGMERKHDNNNS